MLCSHHPVRRKGENFCNGFGEAVSIIFGRSTTVFNLSLTHTTQCRNHQRTLPSHRVLLRHCSIRPSVESKTGHPWDLQPKPNWPPAEQKLPRQMQLNSITVFAGRVRLATKRHHRQERVHRRSRQVSSTLLTWLIVRWIPGIARQNRHAPRPWKPWTMWNPCHMASLLGVL